MNASGTWGAPFVPYYPGAETFHGTHMHTVGYISAQALAGRHVVVVGGGTSAVGFLLELERHAASLAWAVRRPVEFRDGTGLSPEAGATAVALQDAAARAGRALPSIVSGTGIPRTRRVGAGIARGLLVPRPMFTRIGPDWVRWPDGTYTETDVILWATGFRAELRHLAPLRLHEHGGGIRVERGRSIRNPRVFLAGYGPYASTLGAERSGRILARQVVAAL